MNAKMAKQFGDFAEALRMTRRENQNSSRMAGQNVHKRLQQDRFLALDSASTNNHRAGSRLLEPGA